MKKKKGIEPAGRGDGGLWWQWWRKTTLSVSLISPLSNMSGLR
jgi:hypothetical protein